METNWITAAYLVIALFALSGLFRGWWKEAIITISLAFLVFLLQVPEVAQGIINFINLVFATISGILPNSINTTIANFLEINLGIETVNGAIQLDASDGGTWFIILLLVVGIASLIGRFGLPHWFRVKPPYSRYDVTFGGSILGGLLGAMNGFLFISLIGAYMTGRNLPSGSGLSPTAALAVDSTTGFISSGASVKATEVPALSILDSFLPWIFMGFGVFILLVALKSRVKVTKDKDGFRKVEYKAPKGYQKIPWTVKDG